MTGKIRLKKDLDEANNLKGCSLEKKQKEYEINLEKTLRKRLQRIIY